MQIEVKGYLTYKAVIGEQVLQFSEGEHISLIGLMQFLSEDNEDVRAALFTPETNKLLEQTAVMLNGMHYNHLPDGLVTTLKDGDKISIFPPIAGG